MRLYLDTSALIKLYVDEQDSSQVEHAVAQAETTATSLITYVETRAAFARRRRDGSLTVFQYNQVVREFTNDWQRFFVVEVNDLLVRSAGKFAEVHGLRGYDAVHLASADFFQATLREVVTFGCWDDRLETAAGRQGLHLLRSRVQ